MPLREATYGDLLPAAKLLAAGLMDSSLVGEYVHPYRQQYPHDYALFFYRELRRGYVRGRPDDRIVVTYRAGEDGQDDCVTGVAQWHRMRAREPARALSSRASIWALSMYDYLVSFVYSNRAAEPSHEGTFAQLQPFVRHHWTGSRGDCWSLELVAVDAAHRKHGYGRQLVSWGFDLAKQDGVGCSVVADPNTEPFYRSCGYDVDLGTLKDEGDEENPLVKAKVNVGTIMFWDGGKEPQGVKKYGEV